MRYCGIDASSSCTGLCFFDDKELIYYNKFKPLGKYLSPKQTPEEKKMSPYEDDFALKYRAVDIAEQVISVIEEYKPDVIFMEAVPNFARRGSKGNMIIHTLYDLGIVHGTYVSYFKAHPEITVHCVAVDKWRNRLGFLKVETKKRTREEQKAMAVEFVNKQFGLDLTYEKGHKRVTDGDDIAEAICIVWAMIKDN